jgi:hypothetical protein
MLRRYWFEFDFSQDENLASSCKQGCGVTAYDYDDALALMENMVFKDAGLPPVRKVVEDIDISTLDENHVRPNIGIPVFRGVWFPSLPSKSR